MIFKTVNDRMYSIQRFSTLPFKKQCFLSHNIFFHLSMQKLKKIGIRCLAEGLNIRLRLWVPVCDLTTTHSTILAAVAINSQFSFL